MDDSKEVAELAICMGSSCFSRGNKHNIKVIQEFIDRHGLCGRVTLKGHLCEGLCKDGPNITLNGEVHHSLDPASINVLLEQNIKKQE